MNIFSNVILYFMYDIIWAIPRKVTYTLHKKSQLVGQLIKEGEYLNNENKYKASSNFFTSAAKKFLPYLFKFFLGRLLKDKVTYRAKFGL